MLDQLFTVTVPLINEDCNLDQLSASRDVKELEIEEWSFLLYSCTYKFRSMMSPRALNMLPPHIQKPAEIGVALGP
jgi:hypothetical protein